MDVTADFAARLGRGDVSLTARDRELLEAVAEYGSLNRAADELDRSYAHAQRRIVELEEAFGPLVDRNRGGSGGGGSELTDLAEQLLAQLHRLRAEIAGVAAVEETILRGSVADRDGELTTVETPVGPVRALVSRSVDEGTPVEITIRADTVTLHAPGDAPDPTGTSARNRFRGSVSEVEAGESIALVTVTVGAEMNVSALVTRTSLAELSVSAGDELVISFKATATVGVADPLSASEG
jgi:molybdate transport system regulatory protein